ncbi:MAG TPA: rRNA maturation RNase YbeY [Verrucomicrobiota bacterium]|nr:rRNA maturation RNase YbeY [Verrucomicrobiota bacterium]
MCKELTICNRTKILKINLCFFKELLTCALNSLNEQSYEINIIFVNSKEIEKLNNQYLGHIGVTDVISFDYLNYENDYNDSENNSERLKIWGDVFICPEVAIQNAAKFKTTVSKEIIRYSIHGILHLKGYNDETPEEKKLMRKMENKTISLLKSKFDIEKLLIV